MHSIVAFVLSFSVFIGYYPLEIRAEKSVEGQEWVSVADSVYICRSSGAYAYHSHYCQGLKRCTHRIDKVTQKEAIRIGFEKPCGFCY